ncbi:MAG: CopG family transcriptional regulator [Gemmatimonadota bacterium]
MTRTTLKMPPDLLGRLKERAAQEGRSMQELANDLLRDGLARLHDPIPYTLEMEGWEAVTQPGVDLLDRDKLFDLMDGR